jgi:pyruvate/2-oxoglutarate/acetoin dehydrogenase E1 component
MDVSSEIPDANYIVPIGSGIIRREGENVIIIAHLLMMHHSMQAAEMLEKEGISCEVIDPRTLWPLDMELILESVKKTGRVVVVEESPKQGGVGAEIGIQVAEKIPDYLLGPVTRIAAPNTPAPFAPVLEKMYVPQPEHIKDEVEKLMDES